MRMQYRNILMGGGFIGVRVVRRVVLGGWGCFLHRSVGDTAHRWTVSEETTGMALAYGPTQRETWQLALDRIELNSTRMPALVANAIDRTGNALATPAQPKYDEHVRAWAGWLARRIVNDLRGCDDPILRAAVRDDYTGVCRACGAEQSNVEPDAHNIRCESCGKHEVFGAEELVVMHAH